MVVVPAATVPGLAVKLEITGAVPTFTATEAVSFPYVLWAMSLYVVVELGVTAASRKLEPMYEYSPGMENREA